MERLDSNAIVAFGLALGSLAGETVDEIDLTRWVDERLEAIRRKDSEFSQANPNRNCKVTIRTSTRLAGPRGSYDAAANNVLLRRIPDRNGDTHAGEGGIDFAWALANFDDCPEPGGPIGDYGICCYQVGSTRLCIEWTCSVFDYQAYPLI